MSKASKRFGVSSKPTVVREKVVKTIGEGKRVDFIVTKDGNKLHRGGLLTKKARNRATEVKTYKGKKFYGGFVRQ